jgi:hypothetical protein
MKRDATTSSEFQAPKTRYTIAGLIRSWRAISIGRTPSAFSALISAVRARAVVSVPGIPLGFRLGNPFALPNAMIVSINRPVAVLVSAQVQDAKVGPFSFHAFGDFQEMLG